MAKLYAITCGNYSDYRILALCSDSDSAEKMKERINSLKGEYDDKCDIEEFEDCKYHLDENLIGWFVHFDKDGNVTKAVQQSFEDGLSGTVYGQYGHDKVITEVSVNLLAQNIESAIKIAAEKRAVYLAQKEGI